MMNMHRVAASVLARHRTLHRSVSTKVRAKRKDAKTVLLSSSASVAGGIMLAAAYSREDEDAPLARTLRQLGLPSTVACDVQESKEDSKEAEDDDLKEIEADIEIIFDDSDDFGGFPESIRFEQCLAFHRSMLQEYRQRWEYNSEKMKTPTTKGWPRHVPIAQEMPSLEYDWSYCNRRTGDTKDETRRKYCDNLQFRLASFYLQQTEESIQRNGVKLIKDLAERGHADGMCMYGVVLNEGSAPGVESHPQMATIWWRRAVDHHRHVTSTYELAVALFTGEGIAEDEEMAVRYFRRAAQLGHPGAAYMLGDCLLDGVGVRRDRAEALEWLVAAGELGHRGARSRVLAVLEMKEGDDYGKFTDASRQTLVDSVKPQVDDVEEKKWEYGEEDDSALREVSIERRFTIGGGSKNPVVLARRKTVVEESRTP